MARTIRIKPAASRVYFDDEGNVQELEENATDPPGGGTVFLVETITISKAIDLAELHDKPREATALSKGLVIGWKGLKDPSGEEVAFSPDVLERLPIPDLVKLIEWAAGAAAPKKEEQEKNGRSGSSPESKPTSGLDTRASATA